jgi:redox-sensitive bicupin YhaK (pirin superfamily)
MIEMRIAPRQRDLGGFSVRRVLPYAQHRMVGPFVFMDHLGPAEFPPGGGIDVRPHPHIGLSTVTYLFEGNLYHRDTLGSAQNITPGAVNWMTAGRGIAHSERTDPATRAKGHRIHGLQIWVALPKESEEVEPAFAHYPAATLPVVERGGSRIRVIAGSVFGAMSPVKAHSPLFYADIELMDGARLNLAADYSERALYVIAGAIACDGEPVPAGEMAVFKAGGTIELQAGANAHVVVLGGEPLAERRFVWWNFVSSSEARIEEAKQAWKAGAFGLVPGDESEFIPLPEA